MTATTELIAEARRRVRSLASADIETTSEVLLIRLADALEAAVQQPNRDAVAVARAVAVHWRDEYMKRLPIDSSYGIGTHPLGLVIDALDGETDPAQLGVPDAVLAALAVPTTELCEQGHPMTFVCGPDGEGGGMHCWTCWDGAVPATGETYELFPGTREALDALTIRKDATDE